MVIAFDVDGTLISFKDEPRPEIIQILEALSNDGHRIIVWSGGGKDYADMWVRRLKLDGMVDIVMDKVMGKFNPDIKWLENMRTDMVDEVDLCFDDEEVKLARVNIKV